MSEYRLSQRSLDRMADVHPDLQRVAKRAITITKIDFGIPRDGGTRTAERQHELFLDGRSKADGYELVGKHQTGDALDFYAFVDGAASWDREHLAQVASAFLQAAIVEGVRVRWGGLFRSFSDMPHIERVES